MTTIRVHLSEDERYPTYSTSDKGGVPADVEAETVKRWHAAIAAYDAVQDEMGEVHERAEKQAKRERQVAAAERAVEEAQAKLDALKGDQP